MFVYCVVLKMALCEGLGLSDGLVLLEGGMEGCWCCGGFDAAKMLVLVEEGRTRV